MTEQSPKILFQRALIRVLIRRTLLFIGLLGLLYGAVALVYATQTIFKVKQNYAIVLERFGGSRMAVTKVGWHARLPFFTRLEQEVSLMNQTLFLGARSDPMRIISKENVALWTSAMLTYRIRDLRTWAIENLDPLTLLQSDYDGIVKDILQAQEVDKLISGREAIKEEIFKALKNNPINIGGPKLEGKYGIEIISFVLRETRFGDKLIEATEEKKRRQLIAEADNYAAEQEASRIKKLYDAYRESIHTMQEALGTPGEGTNTALFEFLVQQKWATAYEKNQSGQNTFVIQNSGRSAPGLTLMAPQNAKTADTAPPNAKVGPGAE